jgi:hypothetical protein
MKRSKRREGDSASSSCRFGVKVFLVYAPGRVERTRYGIRVEEMPWAEGKHPVTQTYAWFLARSSSSAGRTSTKRSRGPAPGSPRPP